MTIEKIDLHYHQQLSALMDGDLDPDQARFLLRRLQHDSELTGCWERWQLCGDVLRGQAQAPAPEGFAERIAFSIAAVAQPVASASSGLRGRLAKWGGGALAASIAAVALFMVRQQVPQDVPAPQSSAVASQMPLEALPAGPALADATPAAPQTLNAIDAATAVAAAGAASAPLRPAGTSSPTRGSATRTQQASRATALVRAPERATAAVSLPIMHAIATAPANAGRSDPFADVRIESPVARPWPRAVLPQYSPAGGGFNAGFSTDRSAISFYPFDPRLPATPPVALPESARNE